LFKVQAEPPGTPPNPNRMKVPESVKLGMLTRINNDHGVTPDGRTWAISDQSQTVNGRRSSLIYTVPVAGGEGEPLTQPGPVVLSRLVTRRQDARVLRRAHRQLRRLYDFCRWRSGKASDDRGREGRRS